MTSLTVTHGEAASMYLRAATIAERLAAENSRLGHPQSSGELALLCEHYGCDKGAVVWDGPRPYRWLPHTYAGIYEALLSPRRSEIKRIFECGIGSPRDPQNPGELADRSAIPQAPSLHVWRDYFPHAQIFAADICPDCLFEAERIHTGLMDQTDPDSIHACFENFAQNQDHAMGGYDLMIDDGLHTPQAALTLFTHAREYLAADGLYFIEDLNTRELLTLRREFLSTFATDYNFSVFAMAMHYATDNNLILISPRSAPGASHRSERTY